VIRVVIKAVRMEFSDHLRTKMASEKKEELVIPTKKLPDEIPTKSFAATVLSIVEDNVLGSIMTHVILDSVDHILKKEMTKLADDMMKFKKVLGNKMHEAKSLADGEPVWLTRMKESFEAGWEEWRSGLDNREELAYRAFIKVMTSRPE